MGCWGKISELYHGDKCSHASSASRPTPIISAPDLASRQHLYSFTGEIRHRNALHRVKMAERERESFYNSRLYILVSFQDPVSPEIVTQCIK